VAALPAGAEAARFLRFAMVGGAGFLVDAGLLALLHHGGGLDPLSARGISIAFAAFATWRLNRSLTFGASPENQVAEGLRYALVAALAAGLNYVLYALALLAWPGFPPIPAVVLATLAAMALSYAGYSRYVFQRRPATLAPRSHSR
jgi:putative flippase GtrA